jgi:hypothetical protein
MRSSDAQEKAANLIHLHYADGENIEALSQIH